MRKKLAILGLVLFLVGTAALIWVLTEKRKERRLAASYKLKYASEADEYLRQYNEWSQLAPEERTQLPWGLNKYGETKTEIQLRQEQREKLKADLDKLAAGETDVYPFADVLYGENWQEKLSKYKARNRLRELVLTGSTTCMLAGATILAGCLLSWTAVLAALGLGHLKKFSTGVFRRFKATKDKQLPEADAKKDGETLEQNPDKQQSQLKKRAKALINSGWQNFNKNYANRRGPRPLRQRRGEPAPAQIEAGCEDSRRLPEQGCSGSETALSMRSEPCSDDSPENAQKPKQEAKVPDVCENKDVFTQKIAVLLSDEESVELDAAPDAEKCVWGPCNTSQSERPTANFQGSQNGNPLQNAQETALLDSPENSQKLEDSLATQTEDFEKQVQEIKQMAQRVQQAAVEHSGPLNNTLIELTQQVAAIREYASHQQDRVKKLQEGYDWNIIRTFCLRVIRCIDNLENRISQLSSVGSPKDEQNIKTPNLEETRDELVFALESSGVERFEPEINSDYHGQEKSVEAVKEKESSNDPNLTGKIAKVIRPGYQYFIDEENVKVVRTAQVKLFG